jgi:hypothetical protein
MKKQTFLIELDTPDSVTPEQVKQLLRDGLQFRRHKMEEQDPLKKVSFNMINHWSTKHA